MYDIFNEIQDDPKYIRNRVIDICNDLKSALKNNCKRTVCLNKIDVKYEYDQDDREVTDIISRINFVKYMYNDYYYIFEEQNLKRLIIDDQRHLIFVRELLSCEPK